MYTMAREVMIQTHFTSPSMCDFMIRASVHSWNHCGRLVSPADSSPGRKRAQVRIFISLRRGITRQRLLDLF